MTKNNTFPIVAFFDEFDSLAPDIESLQTQLSNTNTIITLFLEHFKKIRPYSNIILCIATHFSDVLDKAIVKKGRLDTKIKFPLPNANLRTEFLKSYLNNTNENDQLIKHIVKNTNGLGYADIKVIIKKQNGKHLMLNHLL